MTLNLLTYSVIFANLVGVILIGVSLLTHKLDSFDIKHRLAIAFVGVGFLGQMLALVQTLLLDTPLLGQHMGFWVIKDVGLVLWFIYLFYDVQIKKICLRIGHRHIDGSTNS